MQRKSDEFYMKKCIELALLGKGQVSPNPMVGCVVLDKNGEIISTGYHKKYGEFHAERNALINTDTAKTEEGTIFVNLEPCSHWGKTPPCTDIIIEKKIKKVVIGMQDVNPKIDGISVLKNAGIEVVTGVLENECKFLNRVFIKNITENLPYVVLKTATTMDGKISTQNGDSKWITSEESRAEVYKMRKEFDCIMTSSNTVIADNPTMEHRFKCIADTNNKISKDSKILSQGKIYHATKYNTPLKDGHLDLRAVLTELYKQGACSVLVECGGTMAGAMLKEGLIDEIYQFIAPKILNDNTGKSCFNGDSVNQISQTTKLTIYDTQSVSDDLLVKSIVRKP